MKAAARFVYSVPTVLFVPIVMFVLTLIWFMWWCFAHAFVYSVGDPESDPTDHADNSGDLVR